jgi:hypothetical protein
MQKTIVFLVIILVSCAREKSDFEIDTFEHEHLVPNPTVKLTGQLTGAEGVLAFSLNGLPYKRIFNSKYELNLPLFFDETVLPVPDSVLVVIRIRCRNQVEPKLKLKVESVFLEKSITESEISFAKCSSGLTNKVFYLKIKDKKALQILPIDTLIVTPI